MTAWSSERHQGCKRWARVQRPRVSADIDGPCCPSQAHVFPAGRIARAAIPYTYERYIDARQVLHISRAAAARLRSCLAMHGQLHVCRVQISGLGSSTRTDAGHSGPLCMQFCTLSSSRP